MRMASRGHHDATGLSIMHPPGRLSCGPSPSGLSIAGKSTDAAGLHARTSTNVLSSINAQDHLLFDVNDAQRGWPKSSISTMQGRQTVQHAGLGSRETREFSFDGCICCI